MASRPSLVTPSGRFELQCSSKFPSVKIPRFVSSRTPEMISRCQRRNSRGPAHRHKELCSQQSSERLSISPVLLFTKDQTQGIMIATESKSRKVNERGNSNEDMDRDT